MTVYLENPHDSTKSLLELTNNFNKVPGYKINVRKLVAFLYNSNVQVDYQVKNAISFTIPIQK